MLRNCRVLLQPTVFVVSLLLIDFTALQQTFSVECTAYHLKGGTLKLRLSEKNKNQRIELEEKATIVQIDGGKFGLRWEKEGEEACFFSDDNCVKKFVEKAAAKVLAVFPEKYDSPKDDGKKHYTYVSYNLQGEKPQPLSSYISKARADAAAAAGGGGGHTRGFVAGGPGAGGVALLASIY
jgi:hypothetical protein